jgi:hypothetical protein
MIGGWVFVWGIVATFGLPLVAVGAILRLCEARWGERRGALGSTRVLTCGLVLCLPLACYFALGPARSLFR